MKVRATERGFFGGRIIEPGDEFECDESAFADAEIDGGWMVKVGRSKSSAPASDEVVFEKRSTDGVLREGEPEEPVKKRGRPAKAEGPSDDDLIAQAKDLTGRDDIATVEEAKEIIAAAGGL